MKILSIDTVQAMNKSIDSSSSDTAGSHSANTNASLDGYLVSLLKSSGVKQDSITSVFNEGLVESVNTSSIYEAVSKAIESLRRQQDSLLNKSVCNWFSIV